LLEVHGVKRSFRIFRAVEVDVSVTQGLTSSGITANSHACHRADGIENLKEKRFRAVAVKITDVKTTRS
jgi:hypothetical protein